MSQISEFMTHTPSNKAIVIHQMVDELARETELPIMVVCKIVADYKGWSVNRIKKYLNIYDEKYLQNFALYQNNKRVSITKMSEACYNILKDKLLSTIEASPFMVPASFLKQILSDWASEAEWI